MSDKSRKFFQRELEILENKSIEADKKEFEKTGEYPNPTSASIQKKVSSNILELHDVFANQNHTNFTASYTMDLLYKLVHFTPLSPLTGEDDEWAKRDNVEYNKRFTSIIRYNKDNSTAVWLDGILFLEPDGKDWFSAKESVRKIEFPFSDFGRYLYKLKYKMEEKPISEQIKDKDFERIG